MTDDASEPRAIPTRRNMLDAMRWLVKDAHQHDSLFFHCMLHLSGTLTADCLSYPLVDSGHGGQTKDLDGDEADGYDEVIYPVDFNENGHIVDDDLHMIMVINVPIPIYFL